MHDLICQAIRDRRLIEVTCKGLVRQVEPYLIFGSKSGDTVLHSWQVGGEGGKTERPDWCNLRVQEIERIQILDRSYQQPHAGYNPFSPRFHIVLCHALHPQTSSIGEVN